MSFTAVTDPSNLSALFLQNKSSNVPLPLQSYEYVGPIRIATDGRSVTHGRGVVANRDITAGECLFVMNPVATADTEKVYTLWKEQAQQALSMTVEQAAEEVLVQEMLHQQASGYSAVVNSFRALMGDVDSKTVATIQTMPSMDCLLGKKKNDDDVDVDSTTPLTEQDCRQIVRRNAFGPDFTTFDYVARQWKKSHEKSTDESTPALKSRLLGMYPLAAMLNHACVPTAVRVFCGDTMVVHALINVTAGQELCWPYLPPTQPYALRRSTLQDKYGFRCQCERCVAEEAVWSGQSTGGELIWQDVDQVVVAASQWNQSALSATVILETDRMALQAAVNKLEAVLFGNTTLMTNQVRRFLRVGYNQLYMNYLNAALSATPTATANKDDLLAVCMELHFAFCSCHNASTEHLSVRERRDTSNGAYGCRVGCWLEYREKH